MQTDFIKVEFWSGTDQKAEYEGVLADIQAERDEDNPGRVAIHTFVDGRGSVTSFYLDRDAAICLAHSLLGEALLR